MIHFKPYLYGRRFLVLTDHQPITYLKTMKDPRGRFARWLQEVSSFDFDINYRPGKMHQDADSLSRRPSTNIPDLEPETVSATTIIGDIQSFKEGQATDPNIRSVLDQLKSGERPPFRGQWRSGVLGAYRRIWHQLVVEDGLLVRRRHAGPIRIVVPATLVSVILSHLHDDSSSGHLGVDKTFLAVHDRFYWPGYAVPVEDYVRTCQVCQRRKGSVPSANAPLQSISSNRPFELAAMDFMELPRSENGNKYCLVVSDYYTRWPEAFALPDQRASTVARVLVDGIVSRHGVPSTLHSDQGGSFDNEVIRALAKMLGMKKVQTSPYHPQSDGLVERMNRTLLDMIAKYVQDKPQTWDTWLQILLFAYRASIQPSVGFSPFRLLYGREPVMPIDVDFSLPRLSRFRDTRQYLQQVQENQRLASELVEENLANAQRRQLVNHHSSEPHQYSDGDLVLSHDPSTRHGASYKLASPWIGPFTVVSNTGPVNYRIRPVSGGSARIVHYNRLKPYYTRAGSPRPDLQLPNRITPETSYSEPDVTINNSDAAAYNSPLIQDIVTETADDDDGDDSGDNDDDDDGGGNDDDDDNDDVRVASEAPAVAPQPPRYSKRLRKDPAWFRDYDVDG